MRAKRPLCSGMIWQNQNNRPQTMDATERQQKIYEYILGQGSVKVGSLCRLLNISQPTARKDLEAMEQRGLILREFGKASLKNHLLPTLLQAQIMHNLGHLGRTRMGQPDGSTPRSKKQRLATTPRLWSKTAKRLSSTAERPPLKWPRPCLPRIVCA